MRDDPALLRAGHRMTLLYSAQGLGGIPSIAGRTGMKKPNTKSRWHEDKTNQHASAATGVGSKGGSGKVCTGNFVPEGGRFGHPGRKLLAGKIALKVNKNPKSMCGFRAGI